MGRRLGELLVAEGRISAKVLARALHLQNTQTHGLRLGGLLLRWGLLPESELLETLSKQHRCPAVDWSTLSAAPKDAVKLLSGTQSTRLSAVPYASDRKTVCVAFANPSNLAAIDEVQSITGKRVIPAVTTEVRLLQAQQHFYKQPIARDVWMILQKIEKPEAPAAMATPPPPIKTRSPWIAAEPEPLSALPADEDHAAEDLLEPAATRLTASGPTTVEQAAGRESIDQAEQPRPMPVSNDPVDLQAVPPLFDGNPASEPLGGRLDPYADDTTLADFIEQALSFYETHPTFRSALDALDEEVENLDPALEQERPPRVLSFDSTLPSPRRSQRDSGDEPTL